MGDASPIYGSTVEQVRAALLPDIDRISRTNAQQEANMVVADKDTNGNVVPTWKAHAYTYDASGNLATDTVTDGTSTWVRTYTTGPTGVTADSGWVKQ